MRETQTINVEENEEHIKVFAELSVAINELARFLHSQKDISERLWLRFKSEVDACDTQEGLLNIIFGKVVAAEAAFQILMNATLQMRGLIPAFKEE